MISLKSVVLALAVASALTLPGAAFAAKGTQLPDGVVHQSVPTTPVLHISKGFYENWGVVSVPTASYGNTPVDAPTKTKCAGTKPCTLHTIAQVQWLPPSAAGQWDICIMVDGLYANKPCYYQGVVSSANGYLSGTDLENASLSVGTHTVQTFIYTEQVGTLSSYQVDYTVSVP